MNCRTLGAVLGIVLLAGCGAPREELLSTTVSPDGRHKASLYRERDPGGGFGQDGYVVYVEQTGETAHQRMEVFSGANAHRTSLDWRDPGMLIVEFCNGRDVRSLSRYPAETRDGSPWVTIQDVRAADVRIGPRVFCPKNKAG